MTEKFQALEKNGAKTSKGWKPSRGTVWVTAFVAGFCWFAFHVVARCLLRQGGEELPRFILFSPFVVGALASIALQRLPKIWNITSAAWLAAALAFGAAWLLKVLPAEQLWLGVAAFDFGLGALVAVVIRGHLSALLPAFIGVATAQPLIKMVIAQAGYTTAFYSLAAVLGVTFLAVAAVQRVRVALLLAGVAVLGIAAFTAPVNLGRATVREGWTFVRRKEGVDAAVTLIEKAGKPGQPIQQQLILDNRHIIAGQLGFGEKRLGHLPLLLTPAAKSVLFLNVNAGVSAGAAKSHIRLEKIDVVEPLAEVASFLPQFVTTNDQLTDEPRAKFIQRDVRDFLAAHGPAYDVIIANPTPPARSQQLFSSDFYSDVKKRLAPGGVFVQWLPLFQLDEANLKTIARTFTRTFGGAQGFIGIHNGELPVFGLFARNGGSPPALADIQSILQPNPGARAYVPDTRDLLGSRLLDSAALAAFAGEGPLHTDAEPALRFPRDTADQSEERGGALLGLLLSAATEPKDRIVEAGTGESAELMDRAVATRAKSLASYLRGDILRGTVRRSADREAQRAMVAEYLGALDIEPDFQLARHMLTAQITLAPASAETIVRGLMKHAPDDPSLKAQLCTVQELSALHVGVPIPPSQCAPGDLKTSPTPPAVPRKIAPGPGVNTNFYTPTGKSPLPAPPAFPAPKK